MPCNVEKPDLASTSMEELEGWVRAKCAAPRLYPNSNPDPDKTDTNTNPPPTPTPTRARYELGSFRPGGDGFLPHVRVKSTSCVGMVEFVGLLFIRLVAASDLPSTEPFGKTDAFCEFQARAGPAPAPRRHSRVSPPPTPSRPHGIAAAYIAAG